MSFLTKITVMTVMVCTSYVGGMSMTLAQENAPAAAESPKIFQAALRAVDAATLMAGQTPVYLWGVMAVDSASATLKLKARTALDNALGNAKAECEAKGQKEGKILAQCVSAGDVDLGLLMLQQGYATADRAAVYGTVFEAPYLQAEAQAQQKNLGVWNESSAGGGNAGEDSAIAGYSLGLFLFIVAVFAVLSIIIMRGFQKVIGAQNDNLDMMRRERRLRDKERAVVAVMLDSELKANKSKIEAYLVVYEEMLKGLQDPERLPKYRKSGDIVQKQPALERAVFERNTDKLDILGRQLASDLVHFYARIKSNPEYVNLEPTTELREAVKIVDEAVRSARKLSDIADTLIDAFAGSEATAAEVFDDVGEVNLNKKAWQKGRTS